MAIDEGRDQFEEQRFEDERRADREADYTPAPPPRVRGAGLMARYSVRPGVSVTTSRRGQGGQHWVAEAASGPWEVGTSEAEAVGKLMMLLATEHDSDCDRLWHFGPCRGPLRSERPETPAEAYERHVEAVESVLRRMNVGDLDGRLFEPPALRELAEGCLAAADVGF